MYQRLRHLCTVGDERSLVELKVMTEVMRLDLEQPSKGNRRTGLHYASSMGHMDVVLHLLQCGSHVHCVDSQGNTPLHLAAANNHAAICQVSSYTFVRPFNTPLPPVAGVPLLSLWQEAAR